MKISGKCSWFGGPFDQGVKPDEALAFIYDVKDAPHLFLSAQPPNTTGLARRLDPRVHYIACRWNYEETPREMLLSHFAQVCAPATGKVVLAVCPADWGPHEDTGRVADLSPGLMAELGIGTDDEVEVEFPAIGFIPKDPMWLSVMRAITGLTEGEGSADNPKILGMRDYIARKWPEMEDYCAQYTHDDIAWCGLCAAFCVSVAGRRPPFGPTDTDKFLWAQAWAYDPGFFSIAAPGPGAIIVMTREGGGHVTFFEYEENDMWYCRGGNQSDSVKVSAYDPSTVIGVMWPKSVKP